MVYVANAGSLRDSLRGRTEESPSMGKFLLANSDVCSSYKVSFSSDDSINDFVAVKDTHHRVDARGPFEHLGAVALHEATGDHDALDLALGLVADRFLDDAEGLVLAGFEEAAGVHDDGIRGDGGLGERAIRVVLAVDPRLTPDIKVCLTPEAAVAARSGYGGTSPVRVREQLDRLTAVLDAQRRWTAAYTGPRG